MSQAEERGYLNVRAVMMTVLILFGSFAVGSALMLIYFNILEGRAAKNDGVASPVVDRKALPPEPRLQYSNIHPSTEVQDLSTMRKHEDSILESYGWVDRPNGVVRMPISVAMDVIAKRGVTQVRTATKPADSAAAPATAASAPAAAPASAAGSAPAAATAPAAHAGGGGASVAAPKSAH